MHTSIMDTDLSTRWPHIKRFLQVRATGEVDDDFILWLSRDGLLSSAERAAGHEEWADFFEWRLTRLPGDRARRHVAETWTDGMAYYCRRAAARARGIDPGKWVPHHERRKDVSGGEMTT